MLIRASHVNKMSKCILNCCYAQASKHIASCWWFKCSQMHQLFARNWHQLATRRRRDYSESDAKNKILLTPWHHGCWMCISCDGSFVSKNQMLRIISNAHCQFRANYLAYLWIFKSIFNKPFCKKKKSPQTQLSATYIYVAIVPSFTTARSIYGVHTRTSATKLSLLLYGLYRQRNI